MFLEFLKFGLPLFFASTATLSGGDAGDMSGEALPADTAGGGEAVETPEEVPETETPETETTEGEGETEETETETASGIDEVGRTVPGHIKKALAALKKVDPKAAEVARRAYFEAGDYKQVYPTVRAARESRDLIESYGGAEGLEGLKGEATDYARELTSMANGDPKIVDELANDYPKSLPTLVGRGLEHVARINPQAFERMLAPHLASTLKDRGVAASVTRLLELIGDGKQNDAYQKAKQLQDWIAGVEEFAKSPAYRPEQDGDDALAQREQQISQREQGIFVGQASRSVKNLGQEAINRVVTPMLKGRNLTAQQRQDLLESIHAKLFKGFEGNQEYQQRMKGMVGDKDLKGIERYVRGQLTADRVKRAVQAIWNLRGFNARPAKAAAGGGVRAGAAAVVATKPTPDQIDWSKDPGKLRFMRGEATLKGGRVVRWKWD